MHPVWLSCKCIFCFNHYFVTTIAIYKHKWHFSSFKERFLLLPASVLGTDIELVLSASSVDLYSKLVGPAPGVLRLQTGLSTITIGWVSLHCTCKWKREFNSSVLSSVSGARVSVKYCKINKIETLTKHHPAWWVTPCSTVFTHRITQHKSEWLL